MSVGASGDIPITHTSDDEYLIKIYLGISFSKFNSAVYCKLFNVTHERGQIVIHQQSDGFVADPRIMKKSELMRFESISL